ncbi:hypothetical protein [Marinobacter sp. Arc7-DN-1]|uniref:hypothetical protein n=1 Tax=Marinobacter sp. Arc7-DN-1 TaxID=2304594 RepID=UPI001D0DAC68|nr:hypothetical protein [Marinobacter sp. Arc7-DN-1]
MTREREQLWQQHITEWQASGLSGMAAVSLRPDVWRTAWNHPLKVMDLRTSSCTIRSKSLLDAPFGSSAESGHMLAVPTELEKPPSCI